jgi:hypothetical protein
MGERVWMIGLSARDTGNARSLAARKASDAVVKGLLITAR